MNPETLNSTFTYKNEDANDQVFSYIFVTVGTTSYDDLITWAQTKETLNYFKKWKVKAVILQIGSSKLHSEGYRIIENIPFEFYSYKPSLTLDYEWADLIISHAGAGTVLDVLDLEKTLFLIPNESLMDNHQVELGDFIHKERYGYSSSLNKSHSMMDSIKRSGLKKFPSRNIEGFLAAVEQTMQFDPLALAKIGPESFSLEINFEMASVVDRKEFVKEDQGPKMEGSGLLSPDIQSTASEPVSEFYENSLTYDEVNEKSLSKKTDKENVSEVYDSTQGSMDSKLSEGPSSTLPVSIDISEAPSGYDLRQKCMLQPRLRSYMEAAQPGLFPVASKLGVLMAAQFEDDFLQILNRGLGNVLEAQRELYLELAETGTEIDLMTSWEWVLVQAISELGYSKFPMKRYPKEVQTHIKNKLVGIRQNIREICRLLLHVSINIRTVYNLLSQLIEKNMKKFQKPKSLMYQKLRMNSDDIQVKPNLHPRQNVLDSSDPTIEWTPEYGLAILNISKIGRIRFQDLSRYQKIALIDLFFDEIQEKIINSVLRVLNTNKTQDEILPPVQSCPKSIHEQPSLKMVQTQNKLEKSILNLNEILELNTEYWNPTLGYVIYENLGNLRLRIAQFIQATEKTSIQFHRSMDDLKKIDKKMKNLLIGVTKGFTPPNKRIAIQFSTVKLSDDIYKTFALNNSSNIEEESVEVTENGSVSDAGGTSKKDVDVEASDAWKEKLSTLKKIKGWLTGVTDGGRGTRK